MDGPILSKNPIHHPSQPNFMQNAYGNENFNHSNYHLENSLKQKDNRRISLMKIDN
jgi:hypothetical protein